jgi:two-component system invasion response regulator UvrY
VTRVLIVDDHAPVRALVRSVIGALAAEIFECSRGDDAVAAVTAHRPDLVLMDIEMPGLDGIDATRAILARFPQVRVAILTQHDVRELRESAERVGACAYVLKDDLLALRQLLVTDDQERTT